MSENQTPPATGVEPGPVYPDHPDCRSNADGTPKKFRVRVGFSEAFVIEAVTFAEARTAAVKKAMEVGLSAFSFGHALPCEAWSSRRTNWGLGAGMFRVIDGKPEFFGGKSSPKPTAENVARWAPKEMLVLDVKAILHLLCGGAIDTPTRGGNLLIASWRGETWTTNDIVEAAKNGNFILHLPGAATVCREEWEQRYEHTWTEMDLMPEAEAETDVSEES